jgi:DNA-binding NarL/FixJ family response regulator
VAGRTREPETEQERCFGAEAPTRRRASPLTARELEVAVLVGRGYSNRRIPEALVIAEKTAEAHARNVREKLGLDTRAQIAAWVAQRGLLDKTEGSD